MKKSIRLIKRDETAMAISIANNFVDTMKFCHERGEGRPAKIADMVGRDSQENSYKIYAYVTDGMARRYDEGSPRISRAAADRIYSDAIDRAHDKVRALIVNGEMTEEEVRKLLSGTSGV